MTRDEIMDRWRRRLSEWSQLQTTVNGERIATEVLADLKAMAEAYDDAQVGLTEASEESGYSTRQLSRMIQDGKLENVGRPSAPRLRRADLPKKVTHLTPAVRGVGLEIARNAIAARPRRAS